MTLFKTFPILIVLFIALAAPLAFAENAPSSAVVGKFGFDWLKPNQARCAAITEAKAATFKTCKHKGKDDEGSFTGEKDFWTCEINKGSEYMIYSTQARCTEEIQTMKANGD